MRNKLKLAVTALCLATSAIAQNTETQVPKGDEQNEQAFTFTEAQLGEDDNVSQTITIVGSNTNVYASEVGYRFSPVRFKYRAYNSKYNEIYINGNPANDIERGEFNFSFVGGLNNQTRSAESSLPFEDNNYAMSPIGGSNNYNFRPSSMATGSRLSLAGGNRNYTLRGMYTYNTGVMPNGWAFSGSITYRWANSETANIEGTYYNAFSYFFGMEKLINDKHSLSLVTWGNPTERAAQAASTDEMYWIANSNYYNPNWGYQGGKKRNSRIINSWAPSALLTWDWKINQSTKLTTSLLGRYSMYSSSRLSYNNATNPAPDYYSLMPSYFYNVWDPNSDSNDDAALASWQASYNSLSASKANRQINWDRLYYANKAAAIQGMDAMYYLQAYHDDQMSLNFSSNLRSQLSKKSELNVGITLSANKGMHYQTLVDMLGATSFRNLNTFVIGTYAEDAAEARYDLNEPADKQIKVGDKFAYDYNILVNKATAWAGYALDLGGTHLFANGRIAGITMQRDGKMRNGLAADNSYGKSGTAKFLEGGGKLGAHINLGHGHTVMLGGSYEYKSPTPRTSFAAAQINNDFVDNLKLERNISAELGYQLNTPWLHANVNGYYSRLEDVTEASMYYDDVNNSFSYVSLTGINKEYYGVELGLNFKVSSSLNIKALGTVSEAKYINNANVSYMLSDGTKDDNGSLYHKDVVVNKGMREGGTPLTATSLDLSYHTHGWYIDLIGNYYDRIYLYYSPITRYYGMLPDNDGDGVREFYDAETGRSYMPESQAKGKGGFMLDASIGKSIYLKHGMLNFNLMLTNILNNTKICTGGMEQNRRDIDETGDEIRTYSFERSPKKFYANGFNGMLIVTYRF